MKNLKKMIINVFGTLLKRKSTLLVVLFAVNSSAFAENRMPESDLIDSWYYEEIALRMMAETIGTIENFDRKTPVITIQSAKTGLNIFSIHGVTGNPSRYSYEVETLLINAMDKDATLEFLNEMKQTAQNFSKFSKLGQDVIVDYLAQNHKSAFIPSNVNLELDFTRVEGLANAFALDVSLTTKKNGLQHSLSLGTRDVAQLLLDLLLVQRNGEFSVKRDKSSLGVVPSKAKQNDLTLSELMQRRDALDGGRSSVNTLKCMSLFSSK